MLFKGVVILNSRILPGFVGVISALSASANGVGLRSNRFFWLIRLARALKNEYSNTILDLTTEFELEAKDGVDVEYKKIWG